MSQAAVKVRRAIPENDPVWQAALRAPIDHGPIPEEERLAVEESLRTGRFTDDEDVEALLEARRPR